MPETAGAPVPVRAEARLSTIGAASHGRSATPSPTSSSASDRQRQLPPAPPATMHVAPLDEGRLTALFGGIARSSSSEAGEGEEEQVAPPARKTPASARGTLWQHPASAACSTPRRLLGSDSEEELLQHAAPRWASPARSPLPSSQPASAARAGTTLHQATPCCAARSTSSGHGCSSGDDGTSQRVQRWTPPSSSGDEGSSSAEEAARTPHWLRWAQRHFVGSGSSSSGSPAAASPAASLGRETPVAQPSPHKLSASASRRPRRSLAPVMAGAALPAGQAAPPGGDGPQAPPPLFAVLPLMVPAEAAAASCASPPRRQQPQQQHRRGRPSSWASTARTGALVLLVLGALHRQSRRCLSSVLPAARRHGSRCSQSSGMQRWQWRPSHLLIACRHRCQRQRSSRGRSPSPLRRQGRLRRLCCGGVAARCSAGSFAAPPLR